MPFKRTILLYMTNVKSYNTSYKNSNHQETKIAEKSSLYSFISELETQYKQDLATVELFKPATKLTLEQQQKFAKVFYHIRGHFDRFLFILGAFAPSKKYKDVVLQNLKGEFSEDLESHEQLYINFCNSLGVDIIEEIVSEENYLPFAKRFNFDIQKYLLQNNYTFKWAAFSAYERLDNVDYNGLYNLAKSFGIDNDALIFFDVHRQAEHFEITEDLLLECWEGSPEDVKQAFKFILSHQLEMWRNLSDEILG
jgi:hypothetical protein